MSRQPLDEDGRQEYALALLEGCDEVEALARGRSAVAATSRSRQLGWLRSRMSVGGQGRVTLMLPEIWDGLNAELAFTDTRDDVQIEADFDSRDKAVDLLGFCTPQQRRALEARFGIATGAPMTFQQVADHLGIVDGAAERLVFRGVERIRRGVAVASTPGELEDQVAEQRRLHKNELNRQRMARYRAQKKERAA